MAALTQDLHLAHKGNLDGFKLAIPAGATDEFFEGAMVYGDATNGLCQVSIPAAGDVFLGVCAKYVNATAGDPIEIYTGGLWALPYTTPTEADIGDVMLMDIDGTPTDNPADAVTVADGALGANDIMIGKVLAIDTEITTTAWVLLDPGWILSATLGWV